MLKPRYERHDGLYQAQRAVKHVRPKAIPFSMNWRMIKADSLVTGEVALDNWPVPTNQYWFGRAKRRVVSRSGSSELYILLNYRYVLLRSQYMAY